MKNLTFFIFLAIFFFSGISLSAQTPTSWTGNVSNDWSDPGNWTNGVPDMNKTAVIGWFSSSNSSPTISSNTSFKKLQMADQGASFELKVANGIVVNINELSMGYTGSPQNFSFNIGNGTVNVIGPGDVSFGGQMLIDTGTFTTSGNFKLESNGILTSQSGTIAIGTQDDLSRFSVEGSAMAYLHQSNLMAGGFLIGGSATLNAGSATFEFYGNMEFNGSQIFIIVGTSKVILNGNVEITQTGDNREVTFYNLIVTENANVVSHIDVIVENYMHNYGNYAHTENSNLNVIGELIGAENINSPFPYLVSLEVVDSYTLRAVFNQELTGISAENADNFDIRNGIGANATILDPISTAPVFEGPDNNVLIITTNNPIVEMQNWVLWIKGVETHYWGSPNDDDGVRNMNGHSVTDPYHKKRFVKDFVVWTGAVSSNWNNPGNWEYNGIGGYPSPGANFDLRYAASVTYGLELSQETVVQNIDNSTFENMDLDGQQLTITGNVNMNGDGKILADEEGSTVLFQGSEEQIIPNGIFQDNTVNNLVIDNSGTGVKLGGDLNILGELTLTNGELDVNGKALVFKCVDNQTAILVPVTGGSISGDVTVERCIPALRAFRFVSPAVTTTESIHENWQEGATSYTDNPNPGYGTHITGVGTNPDQTDGFDFTPSGNPSLFLFDNATQTWGAVSNTDELPLVAGSAYRLMVRGDRSVDVTDNETEPTPTVLRATGTLSVGNKTIPVNQNQGAYNFVGNPYQAIVDMNDVLVDSDNLNPNFYYVWDPYTGTRGSYVTVDLDMGTVDNPDSDANQFLQPGQAFFVSTAAPGEASVLFEESDKAEEGDFTNLFKQEMTTASIHLQLYDAQAYSNGGKAADGFVAFFSNEGSNEVLLNDAAKLGNLDENICSVNGTNYLAIEKRAMPVDGESIPLFTNQYRTTNYTLKVETSNFPENVTAFVHDAYLNTNTEVSNGVTLINFEIDDNISESVAPDRFSITFGLSELSIDKVMSDNVSVYPNPATNGYFHVSVPGMAGKETQVSLYNLLGQKVLSEKMQFDGGNSIEIETNDLAAGAYVVEINNHGKTLVEKVMVE